MMSTADQISLDALAIDPYAVLSRLRAESPVAYAPKLGMWLVTDYENVTDVIRDPRTFSNDSPASTIQQTFGRQMLSVEGEEHKRLKRACLAPFTFAAARDVWAPQIADLCVAELKANASLDRIELMSSLARPVALRTMAIVLGLRTSDLARIYQWYECFAAALANFEGDEEVASRGLRAATEMRSYLESLIDEAKSQPPESTLISKLAAGEGDLLSKSEILGNLLIVLFGGIETTESMIGNTLWWLFQTSDEEGALHSRLRKALEDGTADLLLDKIIEETLRFEPAVQTLTRHATSNTTVGDQSIQSGATVQCMIGGANRDPAVFYQPDRFDTERPNNKDHLSFGLGTHFCLGAQLARMETRCAVKALFGCFPNAAFQEGLSEAPSGHEFRKPSALWIQP